MNRKQALFIALLLLLGGSLLYRFYWSDSAPAGVPFRASTTEGRRPAVNLADYTVRTDLLRASREAKVGEVVNIFAPVVRPSGSGRPGKGPGGEKTPPPPVVAPRPPEVVQAPPPPPPKTPEQLAAERATQDLERFRYLGFVRKGESRSAFLGKGDELLVVKEGQLVKGLYNIKLMNKDYLILADPGTGIEKRLDLAGK